MTESDNAVFKEAASIVEEDALNGKLLLVQSCHHSHNDGQKKAC